MKVEITKVGTSFWQTRRYFWKSSSGWVFFVVCILSITQISFKLIVLLLFRFPAVRMTQWVRNFVAWRIFRFENFFCSLFQDFLERPPSSAFFFLLYPIWASGSFANMLLLCAFDSESWIVYFHQCLWSDTSRLRGSAACGIHLRRHLLSVLQVLALSPFPWMFPAYRFILVVALQFTQGKRDMTKRLTWKL